MEKRLNYCPVRFQAMQQPDAVAISSEQGKLTFKELDRQLNGLEKQFQILGLNAGERLACIAPNSINLILLQLTCLRSGVIFCPLNPRFSDHEIALRLQLLNSQFIWCEQITSALACTSLPFNFSPDKKAVISAEQRPIAALQVVNIIFTSGSSGHPKAVMHSFSNHFYSALGSQAQIPLQNGDKYLLSLPLFHISGYATVIRTLLAGATLILSSKKLTVTRLKKQEITHLSLVATQLYRLLGETAFQQKNLSIKHLLLGGSAFSEPLLTQTGARGFTYHLSYGLTEMSSQVATSSNNFGLQLLKYSELKIINNEIFLRGKTRFVGYFNALLASNQIPETSWFASKDLGQKIGADLHIRGRLDRQFISGGENIQPEEVEQLLLTLPAIKQAYVVAVDDPAFGQRPVAFIDCIAEKIVYKQLDHYLQSKLSRYKRPIHYFSLPEQTGLKVSLKELQQIAQTRVNEISL